MRRGPSWTVLLVPCFAQLRGTQIVFTHRGNKHCVKVTEGVYIWTLSCLHGTTAVLSVVVINLQGWEADMETWREDPRAWPRAPGYGK